MNDDDLQKLALTGQLLQSVGCLITLIVFIVIPLCIVAYACATA